MLPMYFVMTYLFKKRDVEPLKQRYAHNWDQVFKGNVWLVVYMVISFSLIFVFAIWAKQ